MISSHPRPFSYFADDENPPILGLGIPRPFSICFYPTSGTENDVKPLSPQPGPSSQRVDPASNSGHSKNFYCLFCKNTTSQFARHLKTVHKNEEEVQHMIDMPAAQQNEALKILREKSLIMYNESVGKSNEICLFCSMKSTNVLRHIKKSHRDLPMVKSVLSMPVNSSERRKTISDWCDEAVVLYGDVDSDVVDVECPSCHLFFNKKKLWFHYQKCSNDGDAENQERVTDEQDKLSEEYLFINKMVGGMRKDELRNIITNDETLIFLAKIWSQNCKNIAQGKDNIKNLRFLARLLLQAKSQNESIKKLEDLFNPGNFELFKTATQQMGGYDDVTKKYSSPSVPNNIGKLMKKVSNDLKILFTQLKETVKLKHLDAWSNLYKCDFINSVAYSARQLARQRKWDRRKLPPLTQDI